MKLVLGIAILLASLARTASAETKRVAVLVGNNAGNGAQQPLHFAETDAGKMARVLVELGGVDPADLYLLQGKPVATLRQTLALAQQRVAKYQKDATNRVILIFYYSGHSDGLAIELGQDRLGFGELKRWLGGTGAEVRLALVDSCKSGALLSAKGGSPGPAFQIRLTDELSSAGEAVLTSSAANELALESKEIGGSFFTHHFVSGLRGAADTSGDGLVTLTEAYQYAYTHTLTTTSETVIGSQHPGYDYRLSGQGELVLTELGKPSASLELPRGFERVLVIDLGRDQVIAELTSDARNIVVLQPARYGVRAWRGGKAFAGRFAIGANEKRVVRWDELAAATAGAVRAKGGFDEVDSGDPGGLRVFVGAGVQGGIAAELGAVASARIALRTGSLALGVTSSTGTGPEFRETCALLLGGYRLGLRRGRFEGWIGGDLAAGAIWQTTRDTTASPVFAVVPSIGVAVRLGGSVALAVDAQVAASVLERDDAIAVVGVPAVWLGAIIGL